MPRGFGTYSGSGRKSTRNYGAHKKERPKRSIPSLLKAFLPFIRPYTLPIVIGTCCVLLSLVFEKLRPLLMKYLIDSGLTPVLKEDWSVTLYQDALKTCGIAVGAMLALTAAGAILSRIHMFIMHRAGAAMVKDLRVYIYRHLQKLSLNFYESRQTGEIMSRLTGDVDAMERLVTHVSDQIINNIFNLILTLTILFTLSWKLALVALIPVPFLLLLMGGFARRIRPTYRAVRDFFGGVTARLQDNIAGIRVIKAFHTEDEEADRFDTANQEYFNRQIEALQLWTKVFPAMRFLQGLGSILVLGFGAWLLLRPSPEISLGTVIAFNTYVLHLYQPIGTLFRMYDWILRSLASGERILEVIETEPEITDADNAVELPPIQGEIVFDNVSFRYPTGDMVLNNVNLEAAPGQTIALVGHSGAGKTSMVNLIPRFFEPVEGRILVDSYDISEVTLESLRKQIAIVLQDPFLFNGTVLENIRYASPDAPLEAVQSAAEAAYAKEFIDTLPQGYDTEIGERGVKLSGGQKQRLAIARALLADRKILILDEATAMVDSHAEYEIQQALNRLMRNRTTFVIAHRLSTVKNAHQIITLVDGRVDEVGDHKTLMARRGTYSEMYEAQFKLALEDEF